MAKRFIKVFEQIINWEWFRHSNTVHLFIYLLVKANYKDIDCHGKIIKRGQVLTSLPKISTDTGLSIQQTRTALMHLISTGEITDESTRQNRIITIVKYDDYQSSTDKSTDKEPKTNRRSNRQSTDDPTPCIEYIERDRNNRNIESKFRPPTLDDVISYAKEIDSPVDPEYFFDHYESNGWTLKGGQKMKNWKATLRNWTRREKGGRGQASGNAESDHGESKDDYSWLRDTIIYV